jgi:hypothetical protein
MIEELYLSGVIDDNTKKDLTAVEISNELSVPLAKVREVIFGVDELGTDPNCAYRKKMLLGNLVPVKSFVKYKGHIFLKSQATAMKTLQIGLQKVLDKNSDLTITELKDLSIIAGNLDKMSRLESGMPTDIVKSMNLKPERIIAIIKADPMYGGDKDEQGKEETGRSGIGIGSGERSEGDECSRGDGEAIEK